MKDEQMLQYIHKTAEMGKRGIQSIRNEKMNPALGRVLGKQFLEYNRICSDASNCLVERGIEPKRIGSMTRMSVSMSGTMKTLRNHSPSKIAELMIRGTTTGLTKSIKHINHYQGNDHRILALAHDLKQIEESNIEELKPFL